MVLFQPLQAIFFNNFCHSLTDGIDKKPQKPYNVGVHFFKYIIYLKISKNKEI